MKLSTRARYGTRALLDIALNGQDRPILLRDIARRQEISIMYLEHLITPLISAGILRSTRGAKGGVWLAKPPREIKLSEIMQVLEGSLAPVQCVDDPKYCRRSVSCVTREVWSEMKEAMNSVLEGTTLQDLAERQKAKEPAADGMYYI
jgi:Rrf2 family cysteine metabolism transcriptional repressor